MNVDAIAELLPPELVGYQLRVGVQLLHLVKNPANPLDLIPESVCGFVFSPTFQPDIIPDGDNPFPFCVDCLNML